MNKIVGKLYDLWHGDSQARRAFQLWTILIAFVYGTLNSLVLLRPESEVTLETLGLICLLLVGFSTFYCLKSETPEVRSSSLQGAGIFRHRRLIEVGMASIVILLAFYIGSTNLSEFVQRLGVETQLRRVLASPHGPNQNTLNNVESVVRTATARQISTDPRLVSVAGTKLLKESQQNPNAWPAALALADYRSFLNKDLPELGKAAQMATDTPITFYKWAMPKGYSKPDVRIGGNVPLADAADVHPLDQPSLNFGPSGRAVIIAEGGGPALDGMFMKNVFIRDATVFYAGNPTHLENVTFVNCTFVLAKTPNTQQFVEELIKSNSINFEVSGLTGRVGQPLNDFGFVVGRSFAFRRGGVWNIVPTESAVTSGGQPGSIVSTRSVTYGRWIARPFFVNETA